MAGEKPYTPWNMQHNHLRPASVKADLGPIGWHTLRHTYRARLGDNGEALTVQKELMRHASIQTTLNTNFSYAACDYNMARTEPGDTKYFQNAETIHSNNALCRKSSVLTWSCSCRLTFPDSF